MLNIVLYGRFVTYSTCWLNILFSVEGLMFGNKHDHSHRQNDPACIQTSCMKLIRKAWARYIRTKGRDLMTMSEERHWEYWLRLGIRLIAMKVGCSCYLEASIGLCVIWSHSVYTQPASIVFHQLAPTMQCALNLFKEIIMFGLPSKTRVVLNTINFLLCSLCWGSQLKAF